MKKIILGIIASVFIYAVFSLGANTATKPDEKTGLAEGSKQKVLGAQTPAASRDLNLPVSEPAPTAGAAPAPADNPAKAETEASRPASATAVKQPAAKAEIISEPAPIAPKAQSKQIIRGTITEEAGLVPNDYTVKAGAPVRFEINPQDDIEGCMSTIMIERLFEKPFLIKNGKNIVMEFTPKETGEYYIICVMGVEWGKITVIE